MKKIEKIFLALGLILGFAGCKTSTNEVTLTKIEITNPADKVEYLVGEELDTKGLEVTATYSDDTTKEVTDKVTTSGYDKTKTGEQTVIVSYTEDEITVETRYPVTVRDTTVEKIELTAAPAKTKYYIGDSLELAGLKITATYKDGTTADVTDKITTSGFDSKAGAESQTVTVSFGGKTTTFTVTIIGVKELKITKSVTSNKVYQYQKPDTTGLEVTLVYTDNTTKVLGAGKYTVECNSDDTRTEIATVKYGDKTVTYGVQIIALREIEVTENPNKTEFYIDEYFDFAGMEIAAIYTDGKTKIISSEEYTLTGFVSNTYGDNQTITISYREKSTTLTISINWYETPTTLPAGTDGTYGTEGTYVYFGVWPQDVVPVADAITLELESSTTKVTRGYMDFVVGNDGNYYVKCSENAYEKGYKYSDESEITKGNTTSRWFKAMPIKWRVVDTAYDIDGSNGTEAAKLLVAENILTANVPYYFVEPITTNTIRSDNVYTNNYMHSQIRAYLNGLSYKDLKNNQTVTYDNEQYVEKGFLQTAFGQTARNAINDTVVDNSPNSTTNYDTANGSITKSTTYACDSTTDKIFLLSEYEVTKYSRSTESYKSIGKGNSRIRVTTDFAMANTAFQEETVGLGGKWWLRSPDNAYYYSACTVYHNGDATLSNVVKTKEYGVVPALCIEF